MTETEKAMQQEVTVAEGNKRGTGRANADIVVWKTKEEVYNKPPIIVVECKADNITIISDDYYQGAHYARYVKAPFFVTTNIKQTKVFKVNLEGFPNDLDDEIIDIPDASINNNSKKVEELLKQTKAFTRDEFSRLLFKCHSIIRNNDILSPEAAFDEDENETIRIRENSFGAIVKELEKYNLSTTSDDVKGIASEDKTFKLTVSI